MRSSGNSCTASGSPVIATNVYQIDKIHLQYLSVAYDPKRRPASDRGIEKAISRYRARVGAHPARICGGISHCHEDKRDSFVEIKLLMPLYFNIHRDVEQNIHILNQDCWRS